MLFEYGIYQKDMYKEQVISKGVNASNEPQVASRFHKSMFINSINRF